MEACLRSASVAAFTLTLLILTRWRLPSSADPEQGRRSTQPLPVSSQQHRALQLSSASALQ
ncbi:hypothetical protein BEP68_14350 [Microbacterium sp. 4-7]|nr:hypothetical protein [Microbacterium sp. 4-7]